MERANGVEERGFIKMSYLCCDIRMIDLQNGRYMFLINRVELEVNCYGLYERGVRDWVCFCLGEQIDFTLDEITEHLDKCLANKNIAKQQRDYYLRMLEASKTPVILEDAIKWANGLLCTCKNFIQVNYIDKNNKSNNKMYLVETTEVLRSLIDQRVNELADKKEIFYGFGFYHGVFFEKPTETIEVKETKTCQTKESQKYYVISVRIDDIHKGYFCKNLTNELEFSKIQGDVNKYRSRVAAQRVANKLFKDFSNSSGKYHFCVQEFNAGIMTC